MRALAPLEILATEPGGQWLERSRHFQFHRERLGGTEFFHPSVRLLDHITQLREQWGRPDPSWFCLKGLLK